MTGHTARDADSAGPATGTARDEVLEAAGVTLRFGGLTSLDDVTLRVRRGEVLAVIGPNGAGKTSLFNTLTGAYPPQEGRITFRPRTGGTHELRGRKPHVISRLGLARTFQNIRLFGALTALENVKIAHETRQRTDAVSIMLGLPHARRAERESDRRGHELLRFVGLEHRLNEVAAALSYGEQRRLEMARALATGPELLLLDEPAAGTNRTEKQELEALIRRVRDELDVSVLLIEHDMRLVMSVADRVVVLNFGRTIAEGTPAQVQRDPAVVEAYLGTEAGADGEVSGMVAAQASHVASAAAGEPADAPPWSTDGEARGDGPSGTGPASPRDGTDGGRRGDEA